METLYQLRFSELFHVDKLIFVVEVREISFFAACGFYVHLLRIIRLLLIIKEINNFYIEVKHIFLYLRIFEIFIKTQEG